MHLRWIILFVALAAPAFGRDWQLSASATTTLEGQKSRGDITFRFGSRVKGRMIISALNRRVPFRGQVFSSGKVRVKIATRDGLRGSLVFSLLSKAPGHGRISIPGHGVARISFRTQSQRGAGNWPFDEVQGTYTFEASNPAGPFNRIVVKVVDRNCKLEFIGPNFVSSGQGIVIPWGYGGAIDVVPRPPYAPHMRWYKFSHEVKYKEGPVPFRVYYDYTLHDTNRGDTFHFVSFEPREE
jgi:hypothetical protein